ncbi:MAG: twin-arginine translocase TatA/TatE family subunit [Alphaproteobacteria bacterium]|nr:twin-arginine translocase TatA/TatE family subunit [Alphaproteobacteria bacterium]MCB9975574.1 twin-arginine translocase TatA/TatE family subunit [Rhodospirillales bacterium]
MAPGPIQILLIILLVLIIFGAGRVPHIMENLAKGINSFKKGLKEGENDLKKIGQDTDFSDADGASEKKSKVKAEEQD